MMRLHLRLSGNEGDKDRCVSIALPMDAERAFRPLSRERELGGWAAIDALQQIESRRRYADAMGREIVAALMEMIEMGDPVNGYSRAEIYGAADKFRANLKPGPIDYGTLVDEMLEPHP